MNPSPLGPPAQGLIFVAPPRGRYPAHQVRAFDDTVATYIPGGYDVLLGQDFRSLPNFIPYQGPRPHIAPDPFHRPPRTTSAQPMPLEGARQCQTPPLMNVEPRSSPSTKSGMAVVPVPRPDLSLPPGALSPGHSPSAGLAQLPMLAVKEEPIPIGILQDTHDHSGHSTNGVASQTAPELVLPTGKPIPNTITSSNPPPSAANRSRKPTLQKDWESAASPQKSARPATAINRFHTIFAASSAKLLPPKCYTKNYHLLDVINAC
ncbi:WAS/WASL-interacting protein family member 1-like [Macrobrachium nipponense]|uniref:WAS/WASL-interacting protein family member 1-like n=1 Tax=Macrobrachium nipponense TaxID=159736 RepID=UPI0030C7B23E